MVTLWRLFWDKMLEKDRTNYGRIMGVPFFLSAWGIGTADGIVEIVRGGDPMFVVLELAGIGVALYTASKTLNKLADKNQMLYGGSQDTPDPGEESTPR